MFPELGRATKHLLGKIKTLAFAPKRFGGSLGIMVALMGLGVAGFEIYTVGGRVGAFVIAGHLGLAAVGVLLLFTHGSHAYDCLTKIGGWIRLRLSRIQQMPSLNIPPSALHQDGHILVVFYGKDGRDAARISISKGSDSQTASQVAHAVTTAWCAAAQAVAVELPVAARDTEKATLIRLSAATSSVLPAVLRDESPKS
jgi:hypothetical protein